MATASSVLWDDTFLRTINFRVGAGVCAADVLLVEHLLAPPALLPPPSSADDESTRMQEEPWSPELPRTYQEACDSGGFVRSAAGARRSSAFGHRRRPDFEMSPILNEHQSELAHFSVYEGGDRSLALDSFDVAGHSRDVAAAAAAEHVNDNDDGSGWMQNDAYPDPDPADAAAMDTGGDASFGGGNGDVDTDAVVGAVRRLSIDNRPVAQARFAGAAAAPKAAAAASRATSRTATAKGKAHLRGKKVQTTLTFFYDSDEEVDDDDEFDEEGKLPPATAATGPLPPPLPAVRTALGLQKKGAKDVHDRRGATDEGDAEAPAANSALTAWLAGRQRAGVQEVAVAMSPQTRTPTLAALVHHALSNADGAGAAAAAATSSSGRRHLIPSSAVLIVTLKAHVEEWAGHVRNLPWPRLMVYTDTLPKRRKLGAYNLAQYDVVVTTFDVLRAKEAALPDQGASDSDLGSVDSYCSNDDDIGGGDDDDGEGEGEEELFARAPGDRPAHTSKPKKKAAPASKAGQWLVKRTKPGGLVEVSNAHLIEWRQLVVDHGDDTKLKSGTVRGDAVRSLHARRRVSAAVVPAGDKPAFNRFVDASRGLLHVDYDTRDKEMAYDAGGVTYRMR